MGRTTPLFIAAAAMVSALSLILPAYIPRLPRLATAALRIAGAGLFVAAFISIELAYRACVAHYAAH